MIGIIKYMNYYGLIEQELKLQQRQHLLLVYGKEVVMPSKLEICAQRIS